MVYLSCACRSCVGFQLGSKITTLLAPVRFKPKPPALKITHVSETLTKRPQLGNKWASGLIVAGLLVRENQIKSAVFYYSCPPSSSSWT